MQSLNAQVGQPKSDNPQDDAIPLQKLAINKASADKPTGKQVNAFIKKYTDKERAKFKKA